MLQKLLSVVLLLVFAVSAFSQATSDKAAEDAAKLEKAAIEFLRETSVDVGSLRSPENRISFNSELASLMWFHDDKEARVMYGGVVSDFKQLLAQFDAEMNSAAVNPDDEDRGGGGGMFFGGGGRNKTERKFRIAMAVRQQIAMSLAEHAPDMAYNFFYDSLNLVSNPQFRKETEQADKNFEFQLMTRIAESDAAKAAEYGKASLSTGLDANHVELLKKIYAKDPDKGIELGAAILSKMKSDRSSITTPYFYSTLLTFGTSNFETSKKGGGKKAVYSVDDLREIADQFGQMVMEKTVEGDEYSAISYAEQIEKYAPNRAAQIRAKFRSKSTESKAVSTGISMSTGGEPKVIMPAGMENELASAAKDRLAAEEREKAEKKAIDDVKSLATKSLPKDERDKIIAQARKIIAETKGRDKKILALSMLASQVARSGDKELAGEIMRDAERLVNPQPKNYQDFLLSWMLASGYAEADPEKAFPMLENTILRANDTISAFVKVAEFIDTSDELIADGEVQVGLFGGSMIRDLTSELGMANGTIRQLAAADFAKTRNLANTFDRTEVRVLAKMMVLRAVLDKKAKSASMFDMMNEDSGSADVVTNATPVVKRPN